MSSRSTPQKVNIRVYRPSDWSLVKATFCRTHFLATPLALAKAYNWPWFKYPFRAAVGLGLAALGYSYRRFPHTLKPILPTLGSWSVAAVWDWARNAVSVLDKEAWMGVVLLGSGLAYWAVMRWRILRDHDAFIAQSLASDHWDLSAHYRLRPATKTTTRTASGKGDWVAPTPSGFWVAEIGDDVVGFIALGACL